MSGSPFLFTSFLITSLFTSLILGLAGTSASAQDTSGGDDPLQALKERQDKILQVVKNAQPAVVSITSRSRQGSGSGVIINPEGLILTAGHVTSTTGDVLIIILPNGDEVPGEALGAHMSRDAGMARITTDRTDWPYVELGDPDEVTLGQWCVAIGHPGGFDKQRTAPIRAGKVLRKHKGFLVSDCTLAGGDSGGALFDLEGKLIGIHSSISVSLAQNMHVAMDAFEGEDRKRMEADETWGELSQAAVQPAMPSRKFPPPTVRPPVICFATLSWCWL
ncbi:MAG: serine protease, partial [Verrucomicrobiota bacterium]